MMGKRKVTLQLTLAIAGWVFPAVTPAKNLSEEDLVKLVKKNNFSYQQIEARLMGTARDLQRDEVDFSPTATALVNSNDTNEISVFGVTTVPTPSTKTYQLSLSKKMRWGANITASLQSQDYIDLTSGDQVISELALDLEMSLWKNLFGRLDRARSDSLQSTHQINQWQEEIDKLALVQNARNIYWSIVAYNGYLEIYENLVASAKGQLKTIRNLIRRSAADRSDEVQAQATLSQRQSDLDQAKAQVITLQSQLKDLVPEYHPDTHPIHNKDVTSALKRAQTCIQRAGIEQNYVSESRYAKIRSTLPQLESQQIESLDANKMADLQLLAGYSGSGNNTDFGESLNQAIEFDQETKSIGLSLTLPLGSEEEKYLEKERALIRKDISRQRHEIDLILANVQKTSLGLSKSYSSLIQNNLQALKHQKEALRLANEKFEQGRITYLTLLQQEESLLSSEVAVIESHYNYIKNALEFIAVFDSLDCEFNHLSQVGL